MVYIALLPKVNSRRPRVSGQQQDETQQQEQPHQPSKSSYQAGTGTTAAKKQQHNQQQHKQPVRSRVSAKAGSTRRPAKTKQEHAEDREPDPQQLLAYQAALATQVLQREQQALHILHLHQSAGNLHPMVSEQHDVQHAASLTGPPQHAVGGARAQGHIGACEQQLHTAAVGTHQHVQTAAAPLSQQQQQQQQQQQIKNGRQQQPPRQWQQQRQQQQQPHIPVLQQPAQPGQPLHAKRSQNHMFWDVAPRTVNPAQVPGLTDQPAATSRASQTGPGADTHAAAGQQQLDTQPQQPQGHTKQRQQQFNAAAQQPSAPSSHVAADVEAWAHQQHEQSLPGASALVDAAYSPMQPAAGTASKWLVQQQQQQAAAAQRQASPVQQVQPPCGGDKTAELQQALRAAEANPDLDPVTRQRMIKEVKQQMYKLELEQQIAEREAARQARKAAAAAKEAAEAAARAAAPPPWDPAAKLSRRGGGGEPLKGLDGAPVTDLRNQRHMLPVPGLDVSSSQCLNSAAVSPTHQPPHLHSPQHLAHSVSMPSQHTSPSRSHAAAAVSTSAGAAVPAAAPTLSAPPSFNRRGSDSMQSAPGAKCFMGSLAELRAGPSQEQRAAAAAARQQLQRDLEAQMAEKAARAEAQAAAEAARAAAEDAALQQYLLAKSSSQADFAVVGKEASMVYAAAGPLHAPAPQPASASAGVGSSGGPAVLRKGRSRRVIDAPWLDQLKPVQHSQVRTSLQDQHMQLQQQISQLHLSSHHTLPQQHSQQHIAGSSTHAAAGNSGQHDGQLWQETSSFKLGHGTVGADDAGSGAVGAGTALTSRTHGGLPAVLTLPHVRQSMNSQQLAGALQQVQQLQQEQLRMWEDFKRQAHELQQLLTDKEAVAADRDAARAELGRVQELLQQQKQLQEAYAGQQQALLDLQQQQQHYGNSRSSNQYDQGWSWESQMQDCLDAFVVETQMVPISVNNIPSGPVDTQAVSDLSPTAAQQHGEPHSRPTAASGRNQKSRYSSFYGLEAELSTASVSSQTHSPKAAGRKARTRVSGSFRPGMHAAAAAAGAEHHGHSVNSSLAASTSFVPFQLSSMAHKQGQDSGEQQQQQDEQQGLDADHTDATAGSPRTTHRAVQRARKVMGASALAAAADAAGKGTAPGGFTGSGGGMRSNKGSPDRMHGGGSPSRARKNVSPSKGWAH